MRARQTGRSSIGSSQSVYYMVKVLLAVFVGLLRVRPSVRPGDEGLGLTSVLLHLGSRSVLAGVSRVGDDVAARVMAQVHASMAAGIASAEALATALSGEPEPAPFVAFGATW